MNIFAFLAAINTVVSLLIGIFVYTQNRKSLMNKTFGLFSLSVVVWSAGYFLWQNAKTPEDALFWSRVLMIGAILIPILNFHFVLAFLNKVKEQRIVLYLGYALFSFFLLLSFSSSFVSGVEQKLEFLFWPNPGILFHPFLLLWFVYVIYSVVLLLKARGTATQSLRSQIEYILFATAIGYGGGITNFFLWYNIPIPPIGIWAPALYVGIVAYAMVTKQLFGIRILLTQLLVGVISLLLLVNFLSSETPFEYLWKGSLLVAFLITGYLLVRSVMSEIKQREELQQAYAKLKELDEAKSEFVSIASHQLRTPLTAIKGYMSMIMEGSYGNLNEAQQKPMKSVYESNERLIRLVNDLLNISRIESGKIDMKWAKKNIADIIKNVVEEMDIKAKEKKLKLVFEKPEESLPELSLDEEKIRNVLLNILDNAIKYTKKGKIIIRAYTKQEEDVRRSTSNTPSNIMIEVKDTGDGMTQEELSHLFESFSRGGAGTRMSTEGAGLGLYIAKQFMKLHKGKIWAESEGRGEGSTFFIELPVQ
ncbi:MAG: ATP-binding protein [bacterium]|nr:ATP-binding protein [bacterium]